jgi:hypothetical protein
VLTSQGGGGSFTVGVPNPAPSLPGPAAGDSTLSTQVNPGTASTNTGNLAPLAGVKLPTGA